MTDITRVVLIGGPCDGWRADISKTTDQISLTRKNMDRLTYSRLDDPDTGEFLGAYTYDDPEAFAQVWRRGSYDSWANGTARP